MSIDVRHCPLVGSEGRSRPLSVAPAPWDVRECLETGLVYLANPPRQELFMAEFAWEATHAQESARRRREEPVVYSISQAAKALRHRWLKRDKLVDIVRGIAARRDAGPIRLVDIGCSDGGLFLRLVRRLPTGVTDRLEPVGIEISTKLAALADGRLRRHGGRCIHAAGVAGLQRLPPASVDVVILSCVLEHELEPVELLAGCRDRLAGDGAVVVKVPNYACLARRIRGRRWCGYRWPDHVNYFTPRTLAATAARAGLKVARMGMFDRWPLSDSLYAVLTPNAVPLAGRLPRAHAAAA